MLAGSLLAALAFTVDDRIGRFNPENLAAMISVALPVIWLYGAFYGVLMLAEWVARAFS